MATITDPDKARRLGIRVPPGGFALAETSDSRGQTTVAPGVLQRIAEKVAADVPGVYKLGATGLRGLVSRVSGATDAEVGRSQAAITLDLVVVYGHSVSDVAAAVRERLIAAIEHLADRELVAVDINVRDIHVPQAPTPTRGRGLE